MREPEPETIGRAQSGDLRAFEALVRAYQADVWRFAYHLTRDRALSDDVTQDTFLRAFRAIRSYGGQSKFSSWLLRIAHNAAVDHYRRRGREVPVELPDDSLPERGSGQAAATEQRAQIQAAIRELPLALREPFVLIEVLGYDYREASAILGVPVGTLKSRMHRARSVLVRRLTEEEAAGEM